MIALLSILCLIFAGCSNDDEGADSTFSEPKLYQTQWEGSLQFKDSEEIKTYHINISFETESRGRYFSDNLGEHSQYSDKTTIEYEMTDSIITIFGGVHNLVLGDWWIDKSTEDELALVREPNTPNESILILTKL